MARLRFLDGMWPAYLATQLEITPSNRARRRGAPDLYLEDVWVMDMDGYLIVYMDNNNMPGQVVGRFSLKDWDYQWM